MSLKMSLLSLHRCGSHILQRFAVTASSSQRCLTTATGPLLFRATQVVYGEPLKKKKKVDPQILRQRAEKRKRRIEKQIRKLEKAENQLKPIDELEIPITLVHEKELRTRTNPPISEEEEIYRSDLLKKWCAYKTQQAVAEAYMIDSIQASMHRALEELRQESEDLWLEAIQLDPFLVPFHAKGPVNTPPIKNFNSPDGEYIDETKKWE